MNVMAFLSAGVGAKFSGVGGCALFRGVVEVSARVACAWADGIATSTLLQCIFANARRHAREKCLAMGLRMVQTDSFWILTVTRLSLLPRSKLGWVSRIHIQGKRDTNSSICLWLNSGRARAGGLGREGPGCRGVLVRP